MTFQLTPAEDLSLQQVLENGLAVLRNEKISEAQRNRAIQNLGRIFTEARSVSQALHAQNLLFAVDQKPALERFTLFFNYLYPHFGDDLTNRLQEASSVLGALTEQEIPSNAARARTEELIEKLLSAFSEERSLSRLEPPRLFSALS